MEDKSHPQGHSVKHTHVLHTSEKKKLDMEDKSHIPTHSVKHTHVPHTSEKIYTW